jgi:hypothetical protein
MFSTGASSLASSGDIQKVTEIAGYLKKDQGLWILLAGYTDAVGTTSAKQSISLDRAEFVKGEVSEKGGDERRILTLGMADAGAKGGSNAADRLVEVVFYKAASGETPTAEVILASLRGDPPPAAASTSTATATADSGDDDLPEASDDDDGEKKSAKASKSSKGSGEKREHKKMEVTGIKDLDSFFGKAQGMLDKLYTAQDAIADANLNLNTALGIAEGASLGDALEELKSSAKGALTLKMEGTKPKISVKPGASPTVTNGVAALNGLVDGEGHGRARLDAQGRPGPGDRGEDPALEGPDDGQGRRPQGHSDPEDAEGGRGQREAGRRHPRRGEDHARRREVHLRPSEVHLLRRLIGAQTTGGASGPRSSSATPLQARWPWRCCRDQLVTLIVKVLVQKPAGQFAA